MAEPITSVRAVLAFGEQVNNLLLLWCGMASKTGDVFLEFLAVSQICTGSLRPLQELIDEDGMISLEVNRIFTRAGLEEIESLAFKCKLVYRAAVLVIQKAAEDQKSESTADTNKNSPGDEKTDHKTDLLEGPVPDLSSMKTLGLLSKFRGQRSRGWLNQRLDHCGEQLLWINRSLLVHLQIAKVARLSLKQTAVAFDDQLVARTSVHLLWNAYVGSTKKKVREQERAQRLEKLRSERDNSDAVSIITYSTTPSVVTAVNSEVPAAIKTPGNADDSKPAPPSSGSVVPVTVPETTPVKSSSNDGQGPHTRVLPMPVKLKTAKKTDSSLDGLGKKILNTMADWAHSIFGRDDEFKSDYESTELEAYVTYGLGPNLPVRVPFGHRRLQYGLKKVMQVMKQKDQKGLTPFDHFLGSRLYMHSLVDDVVREANRMQKRERTLITYKPFPTFAIFFFCIQPEKQPVAFKDAFGREYSLPFALCKKWEDMRVIIAEAFSNETIGSFQTELGMRVRQGHYDLVKSSTNEFILPGLWNATIKPGDSIIMTIQPRTDRSTSYFGAPGDPRAVAEQQARAERLRRFMTAVPRRPPPPQPHMPIPPRRAPSIISSYSSTSSGSSDDNVKMTTEERTQLTFVNYVEELEKVKTVTVTDLLSKLTNLKDVSSDFLDDAELDGYDSDDSVSDTTTTTVSIIG